MNTGFARELLMAALAILSIALLVVDFMVPLEEFWIDVVYALDLAICSVFAADFVADARSSKETRGYVKQHWIDLLAMVPAYLFAYFESLPLIGAALRSLRFIRLARFIAVVMRMKRARMLVAKGRPSKSKLVVYLSLAGVLLVFYAMFLKDIEKLPYGQYVVESILSAVIFLVALILSEVLYVLLISKIDDLHSRVSVGRVTKVTLLALALAAVISFVFRELLIFVFSFGVIGLILSYSLSPLISNFIGWVYINVRRAYTIGDSVKIGDVRGIVVDIGYLMTTLVEVGDESSFWSVTGRILTVPNSTVLSEIVATYGSRLSPVRVGTVTFNLAYESDLNVVREILVKCVTDYIRPDIDGMLHACESGNCPVAFRSVIEAGPRVIFTPEASWINATVLYPCPPSKLVRSMSDLTEIILRELNKVPEAVKFPVGRNR
ncbi:MAG: mechanosensitive ion channel [Candidatus Verstraetearchaeota archaeon]|nr:mechanosensitive ion channel [Candidatus Verstraetearchaeota archaeon]